MAQCPACLRDYDSETAADECAVQDETEDQRTRQAVKHRRPARREG